MCLHKLSPPRLSHPRGLGAQEGSGLKAAPGPAVLQKKHTSPSGERRRWQVWLLVNQNSLSSRPSGGWHGTYPTGREPRGSSAAPLAWPWCPSAVPLSVPRCFKGPEMASGAPLDVPLRVRMQPALPIPWVERAKHKSSSQPSLLLPGLRSSRGHFLLPVSSP